MIKKIEIFIKIIQGLSKIIEIFSKLIQRLNFKMLLFYNDFICFYMFF